MRFNDTSLFKYVSFFFCVCDSESTSRCHVRKQSAPHNDSEINDAVYLVGLANILLGKDVSDDGSTEFPRMDSYLRLIHFAVGWKSIR